MEEYEIVTVEQLLEQLTEQVNGLTDAMNLISGVILGIIKTLDHAGIRPPVDTNHTQH